MTFNSCERIYWTSDSMTWIPNSSDLKKQTFKNVENRKLNWDDFPGQADHNSRAGAVLMWDICYTYDSVYTYAEQGESSEIWVHANIKVFAGIGSLSWVDSLYRSSRYLLNHEQRHYDIAKFYAEKFRKIIPSLKPLPRFNWLGKLDSVKKIVFMECKIIQQKYDASTKHGTEFIFQEKWNKRVDSLLAAIK